MEWVKEQVGCDRKVPVSFSIVGDGGQERVVLHPRGRDTRPA